MSKPIFLFLLLITIPFCLNHYLSEISSPNYPNSIFSLFTPDYGYSTVSGKLAEENCYFPITISSDDSQIKIKNNFNTEQLTYTKLIEELELKEFISSPSYLFNGNNLMKYLQIIKDTELSFSISYLKSLSKTYQVDYNLNDQDILLNNKGKEIYNDSSLKDKFALLCGDSLITSYNKGISFIVSIKLSFHTKEDKELYISEDKLTDMKYGPLNNALKVLEEKINKLGLNGIIEIFYFQLGGNKETTIDQVRFKNGEKCTFTKTIHCEEMINKIDKYEQDTFTEEYFNTNYLEHDILSINSLTQINSNILNIPSITPNSKIKEAMDYFKDFINRYNYYYTYLQTVPYYPVYSELLNKYLKDTEELLKYFFSSEPINCFNHINDSCVDLYTKISSLSAEKKIEEQLLNTLSTMKVYNVYTIVLKDNLCLKGKLKWDKVYNLNLYMFPNGKGKGVAIYTSDFKFGNIKIDEDTEDFSFDLSDGPFNFNFHIHNRKNNKNMAMITCNESKKNVNTVFHVIKEEKDNPFYFNKYIPL